MERSPASTALRQLGLGALPGLLKRLDATGNDDPARAVLERLSRRLACTVVEVVVAENSVRPDAALAARLEAMKGKPFDPRAFVQTIRDLVSKLPQGVHAFRLAANREGDGTGLTITIDLLDETRASRLGRSGWLAPEPGEEKGRPYCWHFSRRVEAGSKSLLGGSGIARSSVWTGPENTELLDALTKAGAAPVGEPLTVRIQMLAERKKE